MEMGINIRKLRERKGWTQEDLANASGVSQRGISSIEAGKRKNPQIDTVAALAGALGVSIEYLWGGGSSQTTARERVKIALGIDMPEKDAADLEKLTSTQAGRELLAELLEGLLSMPAERQRALAVLSKKH